MKKFIFILYLLLLQTGFAYTQVYFYNNTLEEKSSAIGENNNNQGINSLTVGTNNFVNRGLQNIVLFGEDNLAKYSGLGRSAAFGFSNTVMADYSFAIGRENVASGSGSISIGTANTASGLFSFSLGNFSQSEKKFAFTIGTRVCSSAEGAITIGNAPQNHILNNDNLYSLMVGFNSDLPTFFVKYSLGAGTTGRIGIGNVTSPTAKLHIRADENENAIVRIENTGSDKLAGIVFGDSTQSITTSQEMPFTFNSGGRNYSFQEGNTGFGTDEPQAKVHVKDGDIFIEDIDHGIIMKSPDGNCWRGTLNNQGQLQFIAVNCDELTVSSPEHKPVQNSGIYIYPNPTAGEITIRSEVPLTNAQVNIYTMAGIQAANFVMNGTNLSISSGNFSAGFYIVSINHNGRILKSRQVVVQ